MEGLILVRLRDSGQAYPYNAGSLKLKEGDFVIIEHDRGLDYGQVVSAGAGLNQNNCPKDKEQPKKVIRPASADDLKKIKDNRDKSKEAFTSCAKKITEHKLQMKLVEAEYSFDRAKIIFYFTAEGRVDFRELVKDLAKIFRARIEMRQ
ncbi:MAG: PSP1 domain-containing protein, partial [Candidatus Omnitrophica bacterium]|nr:PSP1 domain-containing protein [Candidatus Omnitrophota bacterium]